MTLVVAQNFGQIVTLSQIFSIQAVSFGGSNIDPTAWEDKKCKGESRFPAQVNLMDAFLYFRLLEACN